MCGIRRWSSFIFLHVSVQYFQYHLLNKLSLVHICACFLGQVFTDYRSVGLFLDSILHWSKRLFLCQYQAVLITMTLQCNLILGSVTPPAFCFFLQITAVIGGLLWFHINFCSSSVKSSSSSIYIIGNLIGIGLQQIKKVLHSKGKHLQNKKITHRMREHIHQYTW